MTQRRSIVRPLIFAASALLGFSCTASDSGVSTPPTGIGDRVVVRISPDADTLLVQTSKVFAASVTVNGVERNVAVDWSTLDPSIATVAGGTVTAVAEGETRLVARAGSAADTAEIVVEAPLDFLLNPTAVSATLGDTITFELTSLDPARLAPQAAQIEWSLSDSAAAQFVSSGVLETLAEGEVQVTARRGKSAATAAVRISRPPISSVVVTPGTLSISVGTSSALSAEVRDTRGRLLRNQEVLWSSSDPAVAVVSLAGVVSATSTGAAIVSASADGKIGTSVVNVYAAPAHSVTLVLPNDTISAGKTMRAVATPRNEAGNPISDRPMAWQSSNPSVATVNSTGLITALIAGQTTISVIVDGKIASERLTVITSVPTSVTVNPSTAFLVVGGTATLAAEVRDQFGGLITGISVTWSSTSPAVASVNASGLVTAHSTGSTTIRAQAGSLVGSATVTVQSVPVATVIISPASAALSVGGTVTFTAGLRDASGDVLTNRPITWTTSNSAVATVTGSGISTAMAPGTATITATAESKSASATVTVAAPPPAPVATVTLTLGSPTLTVGQTTTATARTFDAQGNELFGRPVTFSSANPGVASVTTSGTVTALSAGSTTMTATSGGKSGYASLVVQAPPPAPVATVTLSAPKTTLQVGDSTTLIVTLRDAAGNVLTGRTISFATSSGAIATVSASGTVRGMSAGSATITATSEGKNGTLAFTITAAPPPPPPPVATVTVTLNASTLVVGNGTQAVAVLRDASGNILTGVPIVWASSNTSVATVSSSGYVTAVAAGTANVIATSGGKSGSASLTVQNPPPAPVATVTLTAPTTSLTVGDSTVLMVVLRDAAGNVLSGRPVTFATSNAGIATVAASGQVRGIAAGNATITATSEGKNGTLAFTIAVAPVATVTVTLNPTSVLVGGASQATAVLRDAAGNVLTGRPITWSSSANAIATVNASGSATGVAAGSANITATSEGKTGSASLTVSNVPVATVTVTLNPTSVVVGSTSQATALLRDAAGNVLTGRAITWSSANTAVATVDASGSATGVAAGNANVTATSEGKTGSASLTVTNVPVATVTVTLNPTAVTVGGASQATAVLRDAVGNVLTGRPITWSSSNTAIATVNSSGSATGVAAGSASITATSEGRTGSASLTVTNVPVATVTVTLNPTTVTVGGASQATAVLRDAAGNVLTGRPITWSSSNTAIATVIGSGSATGVAAGSANISATSEGQTGSASLTVQNPAPTTGSLTVTVNGLPGGTNASVTITGPGGFSQLLTATNTLTALVPGSYTVTAAAVTSGGTTYTASNPVQNATVSAGATASVTVTYVGGGPPPSLNLTIDGMHVQQAVQTYGGTVPLVTGRDGLLRVFTKANASNAAQPSVRVRFYSGSTLTSTVTLTAPAGSVPTTISESTLNSSWNYLIPASLMQPGLKILADVDPSNAIAESSESDNSYPTSGNAATMNVQSVALFSGRFVPVIQSVNGLKGGVTSANAAQYAAQTKALYPLGSTDIDVRAPFTTNAPVLQPNDANGAWGRILSEINALRTAEGSTRYYYGLVSVTYNSGVAGLGMVGGRAAIGWDFLPSASEVMAHEVGHNFGRTHAPSCGAGSTDPSYPHSGGTIGVFGYDLANNLLKPTSTFDIMGNCDQAWISDYTYNGVLAYRTANPLRISPILASNAPRRGLLVWGRVEKGQLILEPTFDVTAPPSLPSRPGRHRIEAFGALGERLFELSFDPERVADGQDQTAEHFAFVVPLAPSQIASLVRLQWTANGRQVELMSSGADPQNEDQPTAERVTPSTVRVSWRGAQTRGVLIRDVRSGEILSFGRGGAAVVYTREASVELDVSDGVRSVRQRVQVRTPGSARPLHD